MTNLSPAGKRIATHFVASVDLIFLAHINLFLEPLLFYLFESLIFIFIDFSSRIVIWKSQIVFE